MSPVDHSGKVGWEGQLSQLADLLETDPEAGMQSLGGFLRPMEQEQLDREMPDEHGPMNLTESEILARTYGRTPLAKLGALGHEGSDDYTTCLDARHWLKLPEGMRRLSDEERQMLLDEIEMDML